MSTTQLKPPHRFGTLMEFMSFEQKLAFIAAAEDLYGLDFTETPPFLKGTVHHGRCCLV